ncbi:hypothetical protein FGU65_02925 [Methanoculleus sp. FWC-SCC1]|uniref:RanBP2-type domain-containing protein n=1 Tax=Methanoculleus frigidifontis TaxID=2584085 RepID=A0ABT8M7E9_9EURY|nr:hypothetical protein [Methanoculleus sp. FWC-SCC1]MDN7023853.1 hypothetical protein [Methanoculleus sp. FWC-SCC1]
MKWYDCYICGTRNYIECQTCSNCKATNHLKGSENRKENLKKGLEDDNPAIRYAASRILKEILAL